MVATLHFCPCVLPLANMFGRHGLISANYLPGATTLRGGSSLPDKETLTIVVGKMATMDGLCLLPHPRLRVKSTTIKCIILNIQNLPVSGTTLFKNSRKPQTLQSASSLA